MTNEPTTLETRCAPGVTSSFFGSLELSMSLAPHFVGPTEIYIYEGIDPRLAHDDGGLALNTSAITTTGNVLRSKYTLDE